jgi:hypothetical protein
VARSPLLGSSLALAALLVSSAARADNDIPTGTQPVAYSARPLTIPQMTLSPRVDATLDKLSTTTAGMLFKTDPKYWNLNVAAAASFGIIDNIEVGAVALPLQVLPNVAYGDPSIHGTFRFVKGAFELAAYINTTFITHAGVDPQVTLPVLNSSAGVLFQPGLLSRIHMGQKSKLDIGATVPIQLGSAVHDVGLAIPVEFAFNIVEAFHLGVTSGFGIANVKAPALNSYVPLGFITGVAIGSNDKPVVDIGALFRWPQFADPGMSQKIDTQDFQVGLSVAAYVYFM